jgi:PAS domain S-box-containing protein
VLAGQPFTEREVASLDKERCYLKRIFPYRTQEGSIDGIAVTFIDITGRKRMEEQTTHLASFPRLNPNPVLEVDAMCRVVFSNPATHSILESIGADAADVAVFLPVDLDSILREWDRESETTLYREITIGDRTFGESIFLTPQFDCGRIYAFDITGRKRAQEALAESEERVRHTLESIIAPEGDIGSLDLADIIDPQALQALMDDFHKLVPIPMAIIDLKGRVLVGKGWQDICTKFHRVHPETSENCRESDLQLTAGIPPGEFKLYKCRNNMWDVATPIMVGGKHLGNLFSGQFFFDDEEPDCELFRAQARRYGFDEAEYMAALDRVPHLNREFLGVTLEYFIKFANLVSKLSYSNIKLARSLAEREALTASLRESEARLNRSQEIAHLGSWELDLVNSQLSWSDEVYRIFGLQPGEFGASYEAFLQAVHPEDRAAVDAAYSGSLREGRDRYEIEHRIVRKESGEVRFVHERCEHLRDESGRLIRSVGMVLDITERKRAEEEIQRRVEELRAINEELTRFNDASVGRELRMIDLKKEVNQICQQAGQPPRYTLDFEKEQP